MRNGSIASLLDDGVLGVLYPRGDMRKPATHGIPRDIFYVGLLYPSAGTDPAADNRTFTPRGTRAQSY